MELSPMQIEKPGDVVEPRKAHGDSGPDDWCLESDTMHNVIARRNALLGLWAGRKIGLEGPAMSHYAGLIHFSDFEVPGDADIVRRVCSDLAAHGLEFREAEVRRKLSEFHREALRQTIATD
jgi:hypothetical protein